MLLFLVVGRLCTTPADGDELLLGFADTEFGVFRFRGDAIPGLFDGGIAPVLLAVPGALLSVIGCFQSW